MAVRRKDPNATSRSTRRFQGAPRGRRITSQGGMNTNTEARDLMPLIQQIAHSAQRYEQGKNVNPGGPNQPFTVNPGGTDKSPGPGRKIDPGGPMQQWPGPGGGGGFQWPGPGMRPDPGPHGMPQGGGGGLDPGARFQAQSPVPTGQRAENLQNRFDNYNQYENNFQNRAFPPGPNGMDLGMYATPPISQQEWHQMVQGINPGGPPQGGGHGGGVPIPTAHHPGPPSSWPQPMQRAGGGNGGGGGGGQQPWDPTGAARGDPRPYDPSQLQGNGGNAYDPSMSNQDVRSQWGPQGFGLNGQPGAQQQPQPQPMQGTQHNHGGSQHDHQGGGPGHTHGDGQGGGGGGQNQQQPQYPAVNPTPGTVPTTGASPTGLSPTLGNNYGGTFTSTPNTTPWASYSGPQPAGLAQGSFMNPEAKDTERFTYDTFAGAQTYKPMPGPSTEQPGGNYPFQGYAPPPSNWHYYNPGTGGAFPGANSGYQPMSWDQYASAMQGMSNDIQPRFQQPAAPTNAQNVWWANPVVTDPGYYDPWTEERNLMSHFGGATGGSKAQSDALGLGTPQGTLDYYRYLAHQAGIPGYANLTGPLAAGYHSPNIGGTYGAH